MAITDLLQRFQERRKGDKEEFRQMQKQDRLQTMLEERKKSANERELEKRLKIKREERIKSQLDSLREEDKVKNRQSIFNHKNIFKGHKSVLTNNPKLNMVSTKGQSMGFFK